MTNNKKFTYTGPKRNRRALKIKRSKSNNNKMPMTSSEEIATFFEIFGGEKEFSFKNSGFSVNKFQNTTH